MRLTRLFATAVLFAVVLPNVLTADDKPAKAERITYRVLGLFSPDRAKDLRGAFEELPGLKLVAVNFDDAEITIEFVPSQMFPGQKAERVLELIDQKVRSATHGTFSVKPRRSITRDKLKAITIPVVGLDCKACCLAAYESVAAIDGVEQATASFKDGRVTALIDPKRTNQAQLEDALRKKGVQLGKP